jgi:hypothetical protein
MKQRKNKERGIKQKRDCNKEGMKKQRKRNKAQKRM